MTFDDPVVTYDGLPTDAYFGALMLKTNELWSRMGLDSANPLAQTVSSISTGSINMAITDNGTTVTVTRS
jgi:hypothetical protein